MVTTTAPTGEEFVPEDDSGHRKAAFLGGPRHGADATSTAHTTPVPNSAVMNACRTAVTLMLCITATLRLVGAPGTELIGVPRRATTAV